MGNNNNNDDAAAAFDDYYNTRDDDSYQFQYDDDLVTHEYNLQEESKGASSIYFIIFALLLFSVLIMSKYLHEAPTINKYLSEASLILIVGLIVGFLTETMLEFERPGDVDYSDSEEGKALQQLLSFSPNIFFMALLPPILFNSGYQLRRELFLRHIYPIVMFAVLGTVISSVVCALILFGLQHLGCFSQFDPTLLELFAFGSLIAATDTVSVIAVLQAKRVDPHLFYVVFGESALNDAVALVLFNSFADLLRANKQYSYEALMAFFPEFFIDAIGSPLLGMLFGFAAALVFKAVDLRKKKFRMLELSLYLMLMYVPFIIAESIHLSGIVTIFFAGLSVRRYVTPNVSRVTEKAGATIFQLVAFLAETCIFLELGLSIFGFSGSFQWDFIFYSLATALVARGAAIYPLAFIHNYAVAKEVAKYNAELARSRSQMITEGIVENKNTAAPTTFGAKPTSYVPPAQLATGVDTTGPEEQTQHPHGHSASPGGVGPHPSISSLGDDMLHPSSAQTSPVHVKGTPPKNPHELNTPQFQNKSSNRTFVPHAIDSTLPSVPDGPAPLTPQPLPPANNQTTVQSHLSPQPHYPIPGQTLYKQGPNNVMQPIRIIPLQVPQEFKPRRFNSFDTEDTRHSGTTITTHKSAKRRERRGRWTNNVKKERISWEMMHILWFAGLRGAVAYACVREFPNLHGNADEFTAAVMFIVLFTIVVMGGLTETMLGWLKIEMGVDLEEYMDIFRQEQDMSGGFHEMERQYLYEYATRKPMSEDPSQTINSSQQGEPPVFLGVDSNAFRSMGSGPQDNDYYNWSGFEMACFPGSDGFAEISHDLNDQPHPQSGHAAAAASTAPTTAPTTTAAASKEAQPPGLNLPSIT